MKFECKKNYFEITFKIFLSGKMKFNFSKIVKFVFYIENLNLILKVLLKD